jgi:hypothetical protein
VAYRRGWTVIVTPIPALSHPPPPEDLCKFPCKRAEDNSCVRAVSRLDDILYEDCMAMCTSDWLDESKCRDLCDYIDFYSSNHTCWSQLGNDIVLKMCGLTD